ncbi:MAG: TonB C-terminal domain-containing protein [SAR324 cluster bacterium]|nr:TonB C-terminal domain-containing protein [SAR324 cluster bacterium]
MTENFETGQKFPFFFIISAIFHVILLIVAIVLHPAPTKATLQESTARVGVKYMTHRTAIPFPGSTAPTHKKNIPFPPKIKRASVPKTVRPVAPMPPPRPTKTINAPKANILKAPQAKPRFTSKKKLVLPKPLKPKRQSLVKEPASNTPKLSKRKKPVAALPKLQPTSAAPSLNKKIPSITNPVLPQKFSTPAPPKFSVTPDYNDPKITIQDISRTPEDLKQPLSPPVINTALPVPEALSSSGQDLSPGASMQGNAALPGINFNLTRHVRDQYNALIAAAIKQNLYAPERFDTKISVKIRVAIGLHGELVEYKLQQSSGMEAFDLAALNAVKTTEFHELPEELAKSPPYVVVFKISP